MSAVTHASGVRMALTTDVTHKTALITGAGRRIGRALA